MRRGEGFLALLTSISAAALLVAGGLLAARLDIALLKKQLVECKSSELHLLYQQVFHPGPRRDYVVNVVSWRGENVAFLGEIRSAFVVRKGSIYEKQIHSQLKEQMPVFEIFPSLKYFVILRGLGLVACVLIGILLGATARDLWRVRAIRTGECRSWILWLRLQAEKGVTH